MSGNKDALRVDYLPPGRPYPETSASHGTSSESPGPGAYSAGQAANTEEHKAVAATMRRWLAKGGPDAAQKK